MSEFSAYLEKLRAALDVSPQRADEILAEARTHLEAKAAELQAGGLSRDEAVQEAMEGFGEPSEIARRLSQANAKHGEFSPFRMLAGIAVMFVATLTVMALAGHGGWLDGRWSWLNHRAGLAQSSAAMLIWLVLLAPAALVAGMIGGRRHWWVAATPAVLFVVTLPLYALAMWAKVVQLPEGLLHVLVYPVAALLLWGALGRFGARHAASKALRHWAIFVIAPLYAVLAAVALGAALNGLTAAFMAIIFGEIGIAALLVTAPRECRLEAGLRARCLGALAVLGGALVVTLVASHAEAMYLGGSPGRISVLGWAIAATAVTLLTSALFGYYRWREARDRTITTQ